MTPSAAPGAGRAHAPAGRDGRRGGGRAVGGRPGGAAHGCARAVRRAHRRTWRICSPPHPPCAGWRPWCCWCCAGTSRCGSPRRRRSPRSWAAIVQTPRPLPRATTPTLMSTPAALDVVAAAGAVLLVPSLLWLYTLFQREEPLRRRRWARPQTRSAPEPAQPAHRCPPASSLVIATVARQSRAGEFITVTMAALPDLAAEHGVRNEVLDRLTADYHEHATLLQMRQRQQDGTRQGLPPTADFTPSWTHYSTASTCELRDDLAHARAKRTSPRRWLATRSTPGCGSQCWTATRSVPASARRHPRRPRGRRVGLGDRTAVAAGTPGVRAAPKRAGPAGGSPAFQAKMLSSLMRRTAADSSVDDADRTGSPGRPARSVTPSPTHSTHWPAGTPASSPDSPPSSPARAPVCQPASGHGAPTRSDAPRPHLDGCRPAPCRRSRSQPLPRQWMATRMSAGTRYDRRRAVVGDRAGASRSSAPPRCVARGCDR